MKTSWWLYVEVITKFHGPAMHLSPVAEGLYICLSCLYKQALHSEVSVEWYLVQMCYAENL